jgi:hypothetical protein
MCPVAGFGISGDEQLGSDVMVLVTSSVCFLLLFDMKVDLWNLKEHFMTISAYAALFSLTKILFILQLMFNNCRQYNEEGSMIYEDANKLEEVLAEKMREMGLGTIESVPAASASASASAAAVLSIVATATTPPSDSTSARRAVERRV